MTSVEVNYFNTINWHDYSYKIQNSSLCLHSEKLRGKRKNKEKNIC